MKLASVYFSKNFATFQNVGLLTKSLHDLLKATGELLCRSQAVHWKSSCSNNFMPEHINSHAVQHACGFLSMI